jgi:uncharacterized protein (DUF1684 family)
MPLTLLDWRRRVAAMYGEVPMYGEVRAASRDDPAGALDRFRVAKDALFGTHPDSPIGMDERSAFRGLAYWPHDPTLRFVVPVEPAPAGEVPAPSSLVEDAFSLKRIGLVRLPVGELELYWIDVYGGGLFLPFRDTTSGTETYGAGRYLLDTLKGADLGGDAAGLVVDFNYAYHPSCAYDPRWSCPLAPAANRLVLPIRAGERLLGGLIGGVDTSS